MPNHVTNILTFKGKEKEIMKLSKLNYVTLTEIFRCMMEDKKKARIKLEVWKVI